MTSNDSAWIAPLHPDILALSNKDRRALADDLLMDPPELNPNAPSHLAELSQAHQQGGIRALADAYETLFPGPASK